MMKAISCPLNITHCRGKKVFECQEEANEIISLWKLSRKSPNSLWWPHWKETAWFLPGRRPKGHGFDPWVRTIPLRRLCQPTPVFLPGQSHVQGAWQATVHRVAQSLKQLSTAQ